MREWPKQFTPALGAQWLCAAVDVLLGEKDLSNVPALMSGYGSVLDHPKNHDFARAAFTLRHLGVNASSEIQLRQLVHDAISWEESNRDEDNYVEPPYEISFDRENYPFRRRSGIDHVVNDIVAILMDGLPFDGWKLPTADPSRPMKFNTSIADGSERITVELSGIGAIPEPRKHDLTRRPRGPIEVPLTDLEAIAAEMDEHDLKHPERPRGNWLARLREATGERKFHILAPDREAGTLPETDVIRLDGLKHLIGLPGTGKTTLIVLLLKWLDKNDYRTVVLLPSIEASLNLLGDLRFYGASVGLLVGQAPQTRDEHARKLAERIGAGDSRGFGRTAPGADLMALNCALGDFATDGVDEDRGFPHLMPPCMTLRQKRLKADGSEWGRESTMICPLGGWCGRQKAPRELVSRRIWLGHVLSMDTRIGPHFVDDQVRYFEAVAMTADLVIVDEADGAQANLDRKAISSLDLTGSKSSYEHILNQDLFLPLSAGRNDMLASNVRQYSLLASDFRDLNHNLVVQLQRHRKSYGDKGGPLSQFKDTFVTGNAVITALFCQVLEDPTPEERLKHEQRFNSIRAFWDGSVRRGMVARTAHYDEIEDFDFDPDRVALDIGRTREEVEAGARLIAEHIRDWIAEPLLGQKDAILERMREKVFELLPPRTDLSNDERAELFRFLVGVTTVIMQFLALIPAQQAMVAEGVHYEPLFRQSVSNDFARVIPEALIGRLSGVRFFHDNDGVSGKTSVRLQYVSFRSVPRLLLYRLHELLRHDSHLHLERGPNVLLASATSFLEESPMFHIPVGPDLVLRRTGETEGWKDSRYLFAPIQDRERPSQYLRYSGAPLGRRDRILQKMVEHYFAGETPRIAVMTQDFDPGRKVGFVVNSYDQVRVFKEHVKRGASHYSPRVIAVTDKIPPNNDGDWITAAQVERLGMREDWDALVFPMKSLSRGVNIVFEQGPRVRDAMLGTIVFLIRPHPTTESLDLVTGLAGARALAFDQAQFAPQATAAEMKERWRRERWELMALTRQLLRYPIMASRLGPLAKPFTADIMVDVLQTIGRAMRNGCKARVIFADAAWAPVSALNNGKADTCNTSMLVMMRDILRSRVNDPDPVNREIYRALYEPFLLPLESCEGVRFPDGVYVDDE